MTELNWRNSMHNQDKLPIIIVGGGIGGMATALALAKKEIPCILLEQAPQFRESGAGIQFCPNTFKVLDYLGISKDMADIAVFPEFIRYRDGLNGFEFVSLPLGKEIVRRFGHPFGSFRRTDVLKTFVDNCRKSPFVQLVTSARITEVREEGDKVYAISEKGDVYTGAALIGCDGIWTLVRKYIIDDPQPRISGQIIWRGVVKKDEMPQSIEFDDIVHYVRPLAHLVHYPVGTEGYYNISAIYQTDRLPDPFDTKSDKEELFRYFKGSLPILIELLERIDFSKNWSLCDREPTPNWSRGKMTLLGDAAHATLPYLTSGAGMAVEDAVVVAEKIVDHNFNYEEAFKAYQKERYLRAAYVQYYSRAYGDVHHSSGVARELRNALISKRSVEENFKWVSYLYSGIDLPVESRK